MKLFAYTTFFALVAGTCYAEHPKGDTANDFDLLFVSEQIEDGDFLSTMDFHQSSEMEIMGIDLKQVIDMHCETETQVKSLPQGGSSVDATPLRISMKIQAMGDTMEFDSNNMIDGEQDETSAMLKELIGNKQHFEIDDEGTIVEAEGTGAELVKDIVNQQKQAQLKKQVSTPSINQASRILKLLPSYPVKPGDTWDVSVDLGDLGYYTGTMTLLRYEDFDGHECASLHSKGKLDFDTSQMEDLLGDSASCISVNAAVLEEQTYFDNNAKFVRYSKLTSSLKMEVQDPTDPTAPTFEIPMEQVVETMTKLKEESLADNE